MGKRKKNKKIGLERLVASLVTLICIGLASYFGLQDSGDSQNQVIGNNNSQAQNIIIQDTVLDISDIPEYTGSPYVIINNNKPGFTESEMEVEAFERYSRLDSLGRCGTAYSCVGRETMPTEKRGDISKIKPTGWKAVKYDIVDGKYLYNRCHLIGYQLTAENANEGNLITGTRYMNVEGMLPFENKVAEYIDDTNHHVLYRVTPIFEGNNLVASGVQMEAKSIEDNGKGVCFHVYVYNVQPGIEINYTTGESSLKE